MCVCGGGSGRYTREQRWHHTRHIYPHWGDEACMGPCVSPATTQHRDRGPREGAARGECMAGGESRVGTGCCMVLVVSASTHSTQASCLVPRACGRITPSNTHRHYLRMRLQHRLHHSSWGLVLHSQVQGQHALGIAHCSRLRTSRHASASSHWCHSDGDAQHMVGNERGQDRDRCGGRQEACCVGMWGPWNT